VRSTSSPSVRCAMRSTPTSKLNRPARTLRWWPEARWHYVPLGHAWTRRWATSGARSARELGRRWTTPSGSWDLDHSYLGIRAHGPQARRGCSVAAQRLRSSLPRRDRRRGMASPKCADHLELQLGTPGGGRWRGPSRSSWRRTIAPSIGGERQPTVALPPQSHCLSGDRRSLHASRRCGNSRRLQSAFR
jgi:hypothetical protein